MPELGTLVAVALASIVLVVIPGPAVMYILTRSVSQGRQAGVASAVGVNIGSTLHVVAAVAGLTIILSRSTTAYTTVKWLGVLYLAWIGVRTLLADDEAFTTPEVSPRSIRSILGQGVLVNLLNPKVALFFLAFLPQFVDTASPNAAMQTFVLGMTLVAIGLMSDIAYALLGDKVGEAFRSRPRAARTTRITAGIIYLSLAGVVAATGTRH